MSPSPLGFTCNGTPYFYLLNLQGDVVAVYDSTGEIVIEYTYDSWGKLISSEGPLAGTIGIKNPIRYRGYYYDVETGLYYLQSRYYDPETGRFLNPDAYLIAGDDVLQGTNMYAYCYNNPVMYVDPTGYSTTDDLYKGLATFAMIGGLANVGFTWWASIGELSYDNVYKATEAVGTSINWFYDVYELEISLENSKKLMGKITDMCIAISQVTGEKALDIMIFYFKPDRIGGLFAIYGDRLKEKYTSVFVDLTSETIDIFKTLSVLAATGATQIYSAAIVSLVDVIADFKMEIDTIEEFMLWFEIMQLEKRG